MHGFNGCCFAYGQTGSGEYNGISDGSIMHLIDRIQRRSMLYERNTLYVAPIDSFAFPTFTLKG